MSMISPKEELFLKTIEMIKQATDCKDIYDDLNRIDYAVNNTLTVEGYQYAVKLDDYLRKKYPCIEKMLNIANNMAAKCAKTDSSIPGDSLIIRNLKQDRVGILCHVALKKGISKSTEDFISIS